MNPIAEDFKRLVDKGEELNDVFDQIKVAYRFDPKRASDAKAKVRRAIQIITNTEVELELPPDEIEAITKMVLEIAYKGRERAMFQRMEDGSGIKELFTGRIFKMK